MVYSFGVDVKCVACIVKNDGAGTNSSYDVLAEMYGG